MKHYFYIVALCLLFSPHSSANAKITNPQALSAPGEMVQFKAGDHIIGFQPGKVYFVQTDHALSVEFVGAKHVAPLVNSKGIMAHGRGLASLGRVEYPALWSGITARYEADEHGIAESTYIVEPGADTRRIKLKYNTRVALQKDGSLRHQLPTQRGWMTETKPIAWQEIDGKRVAVAVGFDVKNDQVGFRVGSYDKSRVLVIDPVYQWHTFYGTGQGVGTAVAVDSDGNVYITGFGDGWNGDGAAAPLHAHSGSSDAFVLKLNSAGAYQWHTFYGSSGTEMGVDIAVDAGGSVYVTGNSTATWSGAGGQMPKHDYSGAPIETFILKLNSTGAYQWHTFYPGTGGSGIATGSSGIYVTGTSASAWMGDAAVAPMHAHSGSIFGNTFVLKLSNAGSYQWHTFYGPSGISYGQGNDIATDGNGDVYVMGTSGDTWLADSGAAPLHAHSSAGVPGDMFVLKLTSAGGYQWHTFYGPVGLLGFTGNVLIGADGIAVNNDGSVYVTGVADKSWAGDSGTAPLHAYTASNDIFVLKLNSAGAYQWHTYYGSSGDDYGHGIAVDSSGNAYVTGASDASWQGGNGTNPLTAHGGGSNSIMLKLNSFGAYQLHSFDGSSMVTPDGTGNVNAGYGIAEHNGSVYITGESHASWNGDNGSAPSHTYSGGLSNIFVMKLKEGNNGSTPTGGNIPNGNPSSTGNTSGGGGSVTPIELTIGLGLLVLTVTRVGTQSRRAGPSNN